MKLATAPFSEVHASLPATGRSLSACFDETSVVVFAAHRPEIATYAVEHQQFGGPAWTDDRITRFRLSLPRVMARSDRGTREGKEHLLAIRISRVAFDAVLRQAVHWREFPEGLYETRHQWRLATRFSQVVMDWAPDVDVQGTDLPRFTVRFGVRKQALHAFGADWVQEIADLADIVAAWRSSEDPQTPVMRPYPIPEERLRPRLLWDPAV